MNEQNLENIKQLESEAFLENINSNLMLKKVFAFLNKGKLLKVIKYNKKLINRLNRDINDYIEYSKLYSSIVIELKFENEKYGNFINISEEDEKYYHIYFDNSNKEIKSHCVKENVKIINIRINYQVKSLRNLFYHIENIGSIFFKHFVRNNITDMAYMFSNCLRLKELNLSNFNTDKVIDMSNMFEDCISLNKLNLSNFNTNKVTNMKSMFYNCRSLIELNLSNFNTKNVTDMSNMFDTCLSIKELNLSNFNTDKVIDMSYMFADCSSLININLQHFDIKNVTNMSNMFEGCSSLKELNLYNFHEYIENNMSNMFSN